jgi:hypothetical protein
LQRWFRIYLGRSLIPVMMKLCDKLEARLPHWSRVFRAVAVQGGYAILLGG